MLKIPSLDLTTPGPDITKAMYAAVEAITGAARLHARPPHSPTRHLCTTVSQHKGGAPEPLTRRTMQKVICCIRTLMPVSVPEFQTAISLLPFVFSVHT
jgi:hypothetical protein